MIKDGFPLENIVETIDEVDSAIEQVYNTGLSHLSPDDLATHKLFIDPFLRAKANLEAWTVILSQKYGLTANDSVNENGVIKRE